jgi:hypothetical protein
METYREHVKRKLRRANRSIREDYTCGGIIKLSAVAEYLLSCRDKEIQHELAKSLLQAAQRLDPSIQTHGEVRN